LAAVFHGKLQLAETGEPTVCKPKQGDWRPVAQRRLRARVGVVREQSPWTPILGPCGDTPKCKGLHRMSNQEIPNIHLPFAVVPRGLGIGQPYDRLYPEPHLKPQYPSHAHHAARVTLTNGPLQLQCLVREGLPDWALAPRWPKSASWRENSEGWKDPRKSRCGLDKSHHIPRSLSECAQLWEQAIAPDSIRSTRAPPVRNKLKQVAGVTRNKSLQFANTKIARHQPRPVDTDLSPLELESLKGFPEYR